MANAHARAHFGSACFHWCRFSYCWLATRTHRSLKRTAAFTVKRDTVKLRDRIISEYFDRISGTFYAQDNFWSRNRLTPNCCKKKITCIPELTIKKCFSGWMLWPHGGLVVKHDPKTSCLNCYGQSVTVENSWSIFVYTHTHTYTRTHTVIMHWGCPFGGNSLARQPRMNETEQI